jgi:hypothetical protein
MGRFERQDHDGLGVDDVSREGLVVGYEVDREALHDLTRAELETLARALDALGARGALAELRADIQALLGGALPRQAVGHRSRLSGNNGRGRVLEAGLLCL